ERAHAGLERRDVVPLRDEEGDREADQPADRLGALDRRLRARVRGEADVLVGAAARWSCLFLLAHRTLIRGWSRCCLKTKWMRRSRSPSSISASRTPLYPERVSRTQRPRAWIGGSSGPTSTSITIDSSIARSDGPASSSPAPLRLIVCVRSRLPPW